MKKVIRLTESELSEMVYKIINEEAGAPTISELTKLPNCSRKKDSELAGGVIREVPAPTDRRAAISQSFNKSINTDISLYIVKDKKPFCKLR